VVPKGITSGFVVLIFCTHLTVVACNWFVPQALRSGGSGLAAVASAQLLFALPSLASVAAAGLLAWLLPRPAARTIVDRSAPKEPIGLALEAPCPEPWLQEGPEPCQCQDCVHRRDEVRPPDGAIRLVLVWGALAVGLLHAFQSVTNGLIVFYGHSAAEAGRICAENQAIALLALPFVGVLADLVGQRPVLAVLASLLLVGGGILGLDSAPSEAAWRTALFICAITGVVAPTLALSLVPANTRAVGASYGVLDSLKSLSQAVAMLLIGALRTAGGFPYALAFLAPGIGAVAALTLLVARRASDSARSTGGTAAAQ